MHKMESKDVCQILPCLIQTVGSSQTRFVSGPTIGHCHPKIRLGFDWGLVGIEPSKFLSNVLYQIHEPGFSFQIHISLIVETGPLRSLPLLRLNTHVVKPESSVLEST